MLGQVLERVRRWRQPTCRFCDAVIEGPYVLEDVKVPGYTGRHESAFCCEAHLDGWQRFVRAWEEANYEIPAGNVGPACGGC